MAWLRQLLDWQKETEDPGEFLDSLRFDLYAAEVFVFTPKGDVIALPAGATPVDFAYAVHTEVGHRCIGARVNGRLVPLESTLDNGDLVEVFTSKAAGRRAEPRLAARSSRAPRARNKIRQWFSKERREEAIEHGKDAIARAMRKQSLPIQRLLTGESLVTLAHELRYPDISALYAAIGEGHVSAQTRRAAARRRPSAARRARPRTSPRATTPARGRRKRPRRRRPGCRRQGRRRRLGQAGPLLHAGAGRPDRRLRHPRQRRLGAPHRLRQRRGAVRRSRSGWSRSSGRRPQSSVFLVAIQVEALDRSRLLSDVTRVLSDQHVNILSASVTTTRDRVAISPVHLRDGRPEAPRPRAQGRPRRRGRLRRLPRDLGAQAAGTDRHARALRTSRTGAARRVGERQPPTSGEPLAPRRGGLLGLAGLVGVAGLPGGLGLRVAAWRSTACSCATVASARARASGLVRCHSDSSAPRTASLHPRAAGPRPCRGPSRGTWPMASQRSWTDAQGGPGGAQVGHRQQRLGLGQRAPPSSPGSPAGRRRGPRTTLLAGREERVLGGRGTAPTARPRRRAGPARRPSTPSSARGSARRWAPSRSSPRATRPRRSASPWPRAASGALRVQLGEVRACGACRTPCGRALKRFHSASSDLRSRRGSRLPLVEQGPQPVAAALPLGRSRPAPRPRRRCAPWSPGPRPDLRAGRLGLAPALADLLVERVQPLPQRVQVADRVRVAHRRAQVGQRRRRRPSERARPRTAAARAGRPGRRARRTCGRSRPAPRPARRRDRSRPPARRRPSGRTPCRRRRPGPRAPGRAWARAALPVVPARAVGPGAARGQVLAAVAVPTVPAGAGGARRSLRRGFGELAGRGSARASAGPVWGRARASAGPVWGRARASAGPVWGRARARAARAPARVRPAGPGPARSRAGPVSGTGSGVGATCSGVGAAGSAGGSVVRWRLFGRRRLGRRHALGLRPLLGHVSPARSARTRWSPVEPASRRWCRPRHRPRRPSRRRRGPSVTVPKML